jgi:hypothetical protein
MRLPNGDHAIVDIRKLRDYCLQPDSSRGSNKARVFASALGLTSADASVLRTKLLAVARTSDARLGECDSYGQRFTVDFEMETKAGKAKIRSGWITLSGEHAPRLTTCFVKKGKGNATSKNKIA